MQKLLEARSICKSYAIQHSAKNSVLAYFRFLFSNAKSVSSSFDVLKDINIDLLPNRSLGLIGSNGAGKSTLLKILTGVLNPSSGEVKTNARIGALLELAAGFDMRQTGYQNIYLKNALLGVSKAETTKSIERIIAFAAIGDAIHKPMKYYSSGMVVRLGFAIISEFKPDLLITDEVLAVGDETFQRKCIAWLDNYLSTGGTLLMVSHSTFQINRLCQECIWLKDGQIHMHGPSEQVTKAYTDWVDASGENQQQPTHDKRMSAPGTYRVKEYALSSAGNEITDTIGMGEALNVRLVLHSPDGRKPTPCIGLMRVDGVPVFGVTNRGAATTGYFNEDSRQWEFTLSIPELILLPGRYKLRVHGMDPEEITLCDTQEQDLNVTGSSATLGVVNLQHEWR